MIIAPQFRMFQLETGVSNMLRVPNIIFCLLLCLNCILHNGSAYSIKKPEEQIADDETFVADITDWKCESNSDCSVITSTCINSICQCPPGYIFNGNMTLCVKVVTTYGDDCEESIQCSRYLFSGGICMNSICVCAEGYYYMHGRCNAYSGLFGKCNKDDDCFVSGDFAATSCVNGICECSSGYYQREYRTCRPKAKAVGEKCVIDTDCKQFNNTAYCEFDNVCDLPTISNSTSELLYNNGVLQEKDKNKTATNIGSKCKVDTDCKDLGNAFCKYSETCICKRANFFDQDSGKCVPELGEPCEPGENTNIEYSECRNGKWSCELDRAGSNDNRKCEKAIKRYNNYCRMNIQCFAFGPDAICENNKCVCNEHSRFNETELFCWTKRGIGETCLQDVDCYIDGSDAKLSCTNKLCSCPPGSHPNSNRTDCVYSSTGVGSKCEIDGDCSTENTKCANSVCTCVDNYYESNKQCKAGINSTCSSNNDCAPDNSECASKRCICQKEYVASSVSSCIPVLSFGEPCEEDIQCFSKTTNSICSFNNSATESSTMKFVCVCAKGHHYNFENCFERKDLGMECNNLGECYLDSGDGAVCKNGRCTCDWNYIQINNTVCETIQRYNNSDGSIRTSTIGLVPILLLLIHFFY